MSEEWVRKIAVFKNPTFGYIPMGDHGESGYCLSFGVRMEGGAAILTLWGDEALDVIQAYPMADIRDLEGRPVWVEVEPTGGCPQVRFLEPCLI